MKTIFDSFSKRFIARVVFAWLTGLLIYQFHANLMISQLQAPVLIFPGLDVSYWLFHLTGFPQFIATSKVAAILFDSALFLFALLAFVRGGYWIFSLLSFILFFIYFLLINTYQSWHYHNLVGDLIVILPFCFPGIVSSNLVFRGVRFYVAFLYTSAAFWKIRSGAVFNVDELAGILEHNHVEYFYYAADSLRTSIVSFILQNPVIGHGLYVIGVLLEASFILAFFTRKYDHYLIILGMLFHLGASLAVVVTFAQMWVVFIFFLKWEEILPPKSYSP